VNWVRLHEWDEDWVILGLMKVQRILELTEPDAPPGGTSLPPSDT